MRNIDTVTGAHLKKKKFKGEEKSKFDPSITLEPKVTGDLANSILAVTFVDNSP